MRIAIDSGGTFTDCLFIRNNKLQIIKVPSRPDAPAEGIAEAVTLAVEKEDNQTNLDLVCGTTVGTNALLERRGGRVALITTAGFEDVLAIGRQARSNLYDLFVKKTEPLASLCFGVKERIAADGSVIQSLNKKEIARILRKIKTAQSDSLALCLLFSFRNAVHERQIAAAVRATNYSVSVSHEILPEHREYERTSTTVINAYLVPVMSGYLRDATLRVAMLTGDNKNRKSRTKPTDNISSSSVRIMQSNGGIISAEHAAREPVRTILSGPAGGVIGAAHAAKLAGIEKCISFDMGGTSTDVALLTKELHSTSEATVAGFPVAVPMLEIHTVGAGGGSMARFDEGGALRVGPESAGSVPGPICYGRGTRLTVTDAHAVLGHLGNAGLLGGSFPLDIKRAREYIQREIKSKTTRGSSSARRPAPASRFRSVETFAEGIIAVANAVMEKAIRVISIERGHDPRDYTLIAFGGAGGLHGCDLAAALDMRNVLVPVFPGGLSALGILRADVVKELSRTVLLSAEEIIREPNKVSPMLNTLQSDGARVLRAEGFERSKMRFHHSFDMRYRGQAYELNIPASRNIVAGFHRAHETRYGYHNANQQVEIVNIRCRATGITEKPPPAILSGRKQSERTVPTQTLQLIFNGHPQKARLYLRDDLRAGDIFSGPAVVAEYSATTLVPPGWKVRVDAYGQLLVSRETK